MNFSDRIVRLLSPHRDPPAAAVPPAEAMATTTTATALERPVATGDVAPRPAATAPSLTLQAVLQDVELYLPREQWFKLLQDEGREMTAMEATTYPPDGRKVKTHMINHGSWFYGGLYQLAEALYKLLDAKRDIHFKQLPQAKNKTTTIHRIGKTIASRHLYYLRGDLHDRQEGFNDFILSDEYAAVDGFYILTKSSILDVCFQRYGGDDANIKRPTTDDKVRVAGILITDEEMQEYLPDLTGRSRGGNRQALDASRSRRLAGLSMLQRKFIDDEVVVTIPPKWYLQSTKVSINKKLGEGVFESHGNFNANNPLRMRITWSVKDVTAIFAKMDTEYRKAMDKYTMGTGGGSGSDENFAAWQERDPTNVVTYSSGSQPSLIYLSVVHMWDKQYSFPYVSVKDTMPADCAIDDVNFGGNEDEMGNNNTPPSGSVTVSRSCSLSSGRSSRTERGLEKVMAGFTTASEEASAATRQLIDVVRTGMGGNSGNGNGGSANQQFMPHQLTEHIANTEKLITEYEATIVGKRAARDAIKSGLDSITQKKKKRKELTKEIAGMKKMMHTLRNTLEHQRNQLESVTASADQDNASSCPSDSDSESTSSD